MNRPPRPSRHGGSGSIRIIGGSLRGSKLAVADSDGLRPTPDRVRETLFNWLQPVIHGARCLDLFAGSGASGIEALSRGAGSVCFVERERRIADAVRSNLARLKVAGEVVCRDALALLREPPEKPFDIVFLDPPFALDLLPQAAELLESQHWLASNAWLYIEQPAERQPRLPANWQLHRQARAGALHYALYRRANGEPLQSA